MYQINRLAIVGGTHGNELTGVYLVKKFQQYPNLVNRPSLIPLLLLGNPQAITEVRRYIEIDLNRCFHSQTLANSTPSTYEEVRAQEILQLLQPPDQPPIDAILDLHSTTSNMGLSVILGSKHPLLLKLAAYLSAISPLVKICGHPQPRDSGYLRSLCELSLVIEVGAVAQGILNAELFQQTEQLVYAVMDFFEGYNQGKIPQTDNSLIFHEYIGLIDYPRNEVGEIQAMIHPQLQFKDYQPLYPGDPIFLTFLGKEIYYEGTSCVYPIFINEAAYYEKGIAMLLTQKYDIDLKTID